MQSRSSQGGHTMRSTRSLWQKAFKQFTGSIFFPVAYINKRERQQRTHQPQKLAAAADEQTRGRGAVYISQSSSSSSSAALYIYSRCARNNVDARLQRWRQRAICKVQRVALVKAPIAARPSRNGNALLSRDSLASLLHSLSLSLFIYPPLRV